MRRLATIQRIKTLTQIKNADKIETATILGWHVVVEKGLYKVNDLVVFCEIDSILPEKPEFEFMRPRKFKIRTVRLRGQISQGICFPLNILNPEFGEIIEGKDATDNLGIEKYIPQILANVAGTVKGPFPSFIPKTDETRVQLLQPILDRYAGKECYITEKVDGCSVTYYFKDGEFGVCSRNLELKETPENALWEFARKEDIEKKLKDLKELTGHNYAIQGELIGPGIQKNNLRLEEKKVLFFNLVNIDNYSYADFDLFKIYFEMMHLETVPLMEICTLDNNIENLIKKSIGPSMLNNKIFREGIVIRPLKELIDLQMSNEWGNGRVSFKVINPEYLLKYEE